MTAVPFTAALSLTFLRLVAANIVSVIYGIPRTAPLNQQIGAKMKEAIAGVQSAMVPGKYLVDTFPILRYLPSWLVPGMREGLAFHRQSLDFFTGLVDRVRVQSVSLLLPVLDIYY
jgi:hypothetical protein